MSETLATLSDLVSRLGDAVEGVYAHTSLRAASDDDVLAVMDAAAAVARRAEALIVEAAGEVQTRSQSAVTAERMTTRFGCRNPRELVERVTRVCGRTAGAIVKAARATAATASPTTGEVLPAAYPAMREAFADGVVGVDSVAAVATVLDAADIGREQRDAADGELAAAARGDSGERMVSADDLRLQAQVWAMYLDPDGAEPRDAAAQRKRGVTLGVCRDGLVPLRGQLLPDVAGQVQRVFDSILNPRSAGGPEFVDTLDPDAGEAYDARSAAQRRHDAFATMANAAARSGDLPTIGGATPTLLVSVRAEDLETGRGVGHVDGIDEPIPLTVVRHVACTGGIYRVTLDKNGRATRLEVADRVFNAHQRRVITLRDGQCIIPGCHVPATWCEIHHVQDASRGGPTSTDNGVLLCWFHHRTLETSGWRIRMRLGAPEVRGPAWWDPEGRWRPVTKSPTRRLDRHSQRLRI